jgi:hypothetical protein
MPQTCFSYPSDRPSTPGGQPFIAYPVAPCFSYADTVRPGRTGSACFSYTGTGGACFSYADTGGTCFSYAETAPPSRTGTTCFSY